jgi:16S rRNA (cytosine967-C5)-methyltransferase
MLDAAADAVRPAGLVAYLTCTLNPAENQEQVERILASDKGLSLEKEWHTPFDGPLGEFFYGAVLRRVIQPVSHLDKNPQ